jgi:6-phosphogluconolactonase (cycloisomerase 2 family)
VLRFAGSTADVEGPYGLIGAHGVAVSPDGRDVYVVSFDDNALVVFGRNAGTGGLTYATTHFNGEGDVTGLFRAVALTVAPDGRDLYVASFFGDAIVAFRRDVETGAVSFNEALFGGSGGLLGLTQLEGVVVSPDNAHVYVASYGDNSVTSLRRDRDTGRLEIIDVDVSGENGVSGLFRAAGVAISPDGAHVYAVGGGDSALAAFERDPATGQLDFLEVHFEGRNGVSGLEVPVAVAVSPDGSDVYGLGNNGIAQFRRQASTGLLRFTGVQTEGVVNESGTSGPTALAVSPSGAFVYVARGGDDAVAVLRRDPADGDLSFVEQHDNSLGEMPALAGASSVAVSPDDRSVYVAAQFGDAVSAFQRVCTGDCDGDGVVTIDEIIRGVNIALGGLPLEECRWFDASGDSTVTVDEIVLAVNNSLNDCFHAGS